LETSSRTRASSILHFEQPAPKILIIIATLLVVQGCHSFVLI
jgi:hypothetical protein